MLGNFLKIDYIIVCFLKPINSTCFFIGNDGLSKQRGWISGQPPSYSAAGLDPTHLHKHKCGSSTERVKYGKWQSLTLFTETCSFVRSSKYNPAYTSDPTPRPIGTIVNQTCPAFSEQEREKERCNYMHGNVDVYVKTYDRESKLFINNSNLKKSNFRFIRTESK